MSTIREMFGMNNVAPHAIKGLSGVVSPHVVPSDEIIGIEVEIENVRQADGLNRVWTMIEDGSLRNSGREFVTKPISAAAAPVVLTHLFTVLNDDCCCSPRTSVHIHLNMINEDSTRVIDLIMLYSVFEKLFYRFAGRGRIKNIYCVPLFDTNLMKFLAERNVHNTAWTKYTGLNILPLQNYGTVEFRHMHGTRDVGKLCMWINLITRLKAFVLAQQPGLIRQMIHKMDDDFDYKALLVSIFGELTPLLKFESLSDVTYTSAKMALVSESNTKRVIGRLSSSSEFYKFKEL